MATTAGTAFDELVRRPDELNLFLNTNFARLKVIEHDRLRLSAHRPEKVQIEQSGSGVPSMVLYGVPIYQDEDPVKEAEREVYSIVQQEDPTVAVLFGIGLGYHAEQLERRFPCPLIIFDPCDDAVRCTLQSRMLNLKRAHLITDVARLMGEVEQRIQFNDGIVTAAAHPAYQRLFPKQFEEFVIALNQAKSNAGIIENTTAIRTGDWIRHSTINLPIAARRKCADVLYGKFVGKPGILVSAGPSLDKNIQALKDAQNRAVIVSVNAAAAPLAKAGIKPDVIAVVEGLDLRAQLQDLPRLNEIALAPSLYSFPGFFHLNAKTVLPVTESYALLSEWLHRAFSTKRIASGGSVSCMAFSLLYEFGCDPIILIGQDLAYTGGQSYTAAATFGRQSMRYDADTGRLTAVDAERNGTIETIRKEGGLALLDNFQAVEVPSWGGNGTVLSVKMFTLFRAWFENAARTFAKDHTLINATEGGARISGFREMPLSDTLSTYCTETFDVAAVMDEAEALGPSNNLTALIQVIEEDLADIGQMIRTAKEGAHFAAEAVRIVESEGMIAADPVLRQLSALENELRSLTRNSPIIDSFVSGKVNRLRQERFEDMDDNVTRRTANSLRRMVRLFEVVKEGAVELTNLFVPLVENLREAES